MEEEKENEEMIPMLLSTHCLCVFMFKCNHIENGFTIFSARFQRRQSSFKNLQYICDGDSNGVLHFAGTSYGEH